MRVVVVGGKLQGVEAVYLAKKAGWEVVLVDKNSWVPASELCDQFHSIDVTKVVEWIPFLKDFDLIIPALENQVALDSLVRSAKYADVPLMFDENAYAISSSKIRSNELFGRLGVPAPIPWPECGFPLIVKPSGASGSEGVVKLESSQEFHRLFEKGMKDWVIEEYLEGPSYSLEIIGFSGVYKVLQITELQMDQVYDCKRVVGSAQLSDSLREEFEQIGLSLAKSLNLNGIMDVETILHRGQLKVLEIDARLPSQTPIAVYHATGINMLEILGQAFVLNKSWSAFEIIEKCGAILEHIQVGYDCLEVSGEHIMAGVGPLYLYPDFFGADEALTNYSPGKTEWAATLIITGLDLKEAWNKRCAVIQAIRKEWGIRHYLDRYPVYEESVKHTKSASGS
ncbi:3-methylornithine--L-lysine ligase PylC [Desulfosporosinus sp. BICA1-9]|uniref:3-methylornithine--L-lysine ligase PylC n=1 Tax=Desulfosporosinus sp. BICA1-9 TaxID=1531958 RepID=UPI00054B35B5|nr:3-methylornithine--L-lysine ligase PylC [Desulfosporosinus sp. BICA1-9]KJS46013.1 MAG: pyrrolysine biosynthesis protein PylC [Peptococcaceae bacterium BRH_c23]KJS80316.1 MAG: pyrrolysine biosynthesis protein PylC [Desulfosporosinus sp. BICA1-9]HBW37629.1 3-methylornithine--L-lysine ligase PylC [Desulfosporosinus sp.]